MIAMTQKSIGQYLAFLLAEYIFKHTLVNILRWRIKKTGRHYHRVLIIQQ